MRGRTPFETDISLPARWKRPLWLTEPLALVAECLADPFELAFTPDYSDGQLTVAPWFDDFQIRDNLERALEAGSQRAGLKLRELERTFNRHNSIEKMAIALCVFDGLQAMHKWVLRAHLRRCSHEKLGASKSNLLRACQTMAPARSINQPSFGGCSLLHFAAHCGTVTLVNALIEEGADVNAAAPKARHSTEERPLHAIFWYSEHANAEAAAIVDRLVDAGADVDASNTLGETALHLAVRRRSLAVAHALLLRNANLDALDNAERSPYAIVKSDPDDGLAAKFDAMFTNVQLTRGMSVRPQGNFRKRF